MNMILNLLLAAQILSALAMIGLILVQHGKGADMGAAFGSGSSGSLFGASGSANFLSRTTAGLATVFFACTLALAYFGNARPTQAPSGGSSVLERSAVTAPAASDVAPPTSAPSGADSIPGASTSRPSAEVPAPAPVTGASGAAGIPTK